MNKRIINLSKILIALFLVAPMAIMANSAELDIAVKAYYGGRPAEAVELIKPLAQAGDISAQYLLGNILYSLSQTRQVNLGDEAVEWYTKAAMQGSAEANNALGNIYYNRWIDSRQQKDAALAISFYEKAIGLGTKVKQEPLTKLKRLSGVSPEKAVYLAKKIAEAAKQSPITAGKPESGIAITKPIVEMDVPAVAGVNVSDAEKPKTTTEAPELLSEDSKPEVDITKLVADASNSDTEKVVLQGERPLMVLNLEEIAHECGNYTPVGFGIYADTIEGAMVIGKAKVRKIDPGILRLVLKKREVSVQLSLKDTPQKLIKGLQTGDDFVVRGTILQSQLVETECTIHMQYNP